jgi:hypothetical protein
MRSHPHPRWLVIHIARLLITDATLDFYEDSLKILMDKLSEGGYHPYLTTVGGSGLGVYPVTGEPTLQEKEELQSAFVDQPRTSLAKWAEEQGGWLYV